MHCRLVRVGGLEPGVTPGRPFAQICIPGGSSGPSSQDLSRKQSLGFWAVCVYVYGGACVHSCADEVGVGAASADLVECQGSTVVPRYSLVCSGTCDKYRTSEE